MANVQNLKPIKKGQLSKEEAKRRGSLGGKKSAEVRRSMKSFRQVFEEELDDEKLQKIFNAMYKRALNGDTRSAEFIRDTAGQKPVEKTQIIDPPTILLERPVDESLL